MIHDPIHPPIHDQACTCGRCRHAAETEVRADVVVIIAGAAIGTVAAIGLLIAKHGPAIASFIGL